MNFSDLLRVAVPLEGARLGAQNQKRFQDILLGQQAEDRQLKNDLTRAQIGHLSAPTPSDWAVQEADGGLVRVNKSTGETMPIMLNGQQLKPKKTAPLPGTPEWKAAEIDKAKIGAQYGYHPPVQDDRTIAPVQQPDGSVVYEKRADAIGQHAPSPNATGKAAIQKAVAENGTQLSVIDDAISELTKHPDAIGTKRGGLAAVVPFAGNLQDKINQTVDPEGVNARASLANIGSMTIKDRSGSAVTVSEYPRLRPFVPTELDDYPSAVKKLKKLRAAIQTETDLLQRSSGIGTHSPSDAGGNINLSAPQTSTNQGHTASRAQQLWDAAVKLHGEAKVLQEFGPRPEK